MSPMSPSPGISTSSRSPPPGSRPSIPSRVPSRVTTACPAQASPPISATKSASTVPARARSSTGAITTPAPRRDRRKNQDSRSAPTRPTPSGVISMAVVAWAPSRPKADTSPDGVTDPRPERHNRRRHRPEFARRVGLQQMQAECRRTRHSDQRPAHGGDRGEQSRPPTARSCHGQLSGRSWSDPPIRIAALYR